MPRPYFRRVVVNLTIQRRDLGRFGEETAASYLRHKGFNIIERNYRQRIGELDIIARQGSCLVFVEVRTKTDDRCGLPEESVTAVKIKKLRRLAQSYLQARSIKSDQDIRFDVVAIMHTNGQTTINHIENAF